jgi:hypothetical protein
MSTLLGESKYARKALDAYWTEPWVTEWLLSYGLKVPEGSVIWEPAAGVGHISKVLLAHGFDVLSTDVFNHGWDGLTGLQDFLTVEEVDPTIQCIFTNPPYDIQGVPGVSDVTAEQFVRHALKLMKPVDGCVMMLLRHEFDCAGGRRDLFNQKPFAAKFVLTKRPNWLDPEEQKAEGKTPKPRHNYAWFYWDWRFKGEHPYTISLPKEG